MNRYDVVRSNMLFRNNTKYKNDRYLIKNNDS